MRVVDLHRMTTLLTAAAIETFEGKRYDALQTWLDINANSSLHLCVSAEDTNALGLASKPWCVRRWRAAFQLHSKYSPPKSV